MFGEAVDGARQSEQLGPSDRERKRECTETPTLFREKTAVFHALPRAPRAQRLALTPSGDPRSMQFNQMNTCSLRYAMFARCAKELGDDHTRCKCGKKHNERKREADKSGEGPARGEERERETETERDGDRKRTKNSGERRDGGGQGGTGRMANKA
ncbi:hypothetical protein TGFOU_306390 [Toxoplasma gondii FOU]|uniref:Uncharacterized protein n=1 Tax=Toxoplasma gondii FOU TaxID=943167 RepID=A0A086KKG2_TOXGO|nr:hypothetical protein TGFOU_306390 [Toxoplasma gondii FOU]